jgi:hypothetical protein
MTIQAQRFTGLPACFTVLASLTLIQACGQPEPGRLAGPTAVATTSTPVQTQPSTQRDTALRVVIKLRSSGTGREAALLAGLSRQAQASVSYVSSIAPDTHVYIIEPTVSQRVNELLTRLRAAPSVAFVEIDRPVPSR